MLVVKALCGTVVLAFVAALLLWVMSGYRSGVAEVVDGGHVRVGGEVVRLYGVDALEPDQMCRDGGAQWACGARARAELAKRVADRTVRCRLEGVSEDGEGLGVCFVGLEDVGHELVEAGWALADLGVPERYGGAELQARDRLAGIWRSVFTTPAYWRLSHARPARGSVPSRSVAEGQINGWSVVAWLLCGSAVLGFFWRARAAFQQGGAVTHRWRIRRAQRVLALLREIGVKRGPGAQFAYLRKVDPWVVEELVLTALARQGHRIKRNARYTGDGGLDGRCWVDRKLHLIQVKRYGGYIAAEDVFAFARVCEAHGAEGLFIHTGRTGAAAAAAGSQPGVRIVSGRKLLELLDVRPRISSEVWMDTQPGASTQGTRSEELLR
jgi:restriction system protein